VHAGAIDVGDVTGFHESQIAANGARQAPADILDLRRQRSRRACARRWTARLIFSGSSEPNPMRED